jgi:hypothetical protein
MGTRTRALCITGVLVVAVGVASPAANGQGLHPLPRHLRPLHERLAAADAAVVATVGEVGTGRIELLEVSALVGGVTTGAQVKRAPSNPLPVAPGDRVLLLLQGARSPYVAVDTPRETVRLADPDAEARWSEAIRVLDGSRDRPAAWVELYVGWLETGPGSLRDLAVASLSDPGAPYQPLPPSFFTARAAAAWDASGAAEGRRAAARLAAQHPAGAAELAARAAACRAGSDPDVVELSAIAAIRYGRSDHDGAVLCALDHAHAGVRASTLAVIGRTSLPTSAEVRARVERLAEDDPESFVRDAARQALARLS